MRPSSNPVDHLIRELIDTRRSTAPGEVQRILEHVATAPFCQEVVRVPPKHRGRSYQGRALSNREDSLFFHLVKRVVVDEQWASGTTEQDYLEDLRQAARDTSAQLVIYKRGVDNIAGVLAPNIVPKSRRGANVLPFIYVIYSADSGIVVTGHQVSGLHTVGIPPGSARWLN